MGHSVVTTVRSQDKANNIRDAHPNVPKSRLDFAVAEYIAQEGCFDEAVISSPPFEAVIHTASPELPVSYIATEVRTYLPKNDEEFSNLSEKNAPAVKRVVITSSFASIIDGAKGPRTPHKTYSDWDWNPITEEDALKNPSNGNRASKTFAKQAAWEFKENETPNFTIATICPPLVFGPIIHYLNSLDRLNTPNQRIRDFITGKYKEEIPDTGIYIWTDVRDVALAHVKAMELSDAAGKRFFVTTGYFSNKEICEIIRKHFPGYEDKLPKSEIKGGDYPEGGVYGYDNSRAIKVLCLKFRTLEESVMDTVKSLQSLAA